MDFKEPDEDDYEVWTITIHVDAITNHSDEANDDAAGPIYLMRLYLCTCVHMLVHILSGSCHRLCNAILICNNNDNGH